MLVLLPSVSDPPLWTLRWTSSAPPSVDPLYKYHSPQPEQWGMEENIQLHTLMGELCLHSWTLVWCQTMGGNLAMAIFMSRFPPILWHKHATTKSGDPIVQHSYAMNTHACSIPFCNCMFVLDKGWNSGYIHGLLYGARQGVELWLYSCIVGWTHWQVKYAWLYYSETDTLQQRTPTIQQKSRLSFHSLQYLSNPWIADTPLLRITDSFCGSNCSQTIRT